MFLWLVFSLLTAATLALILRPLARPAVRVEGDTAAEGTLAVYRDQLTEIEAEARRGVIDAAEAEAARIEVSRRMLAAAEATAKASSPSTSDLGRRLAFAVAAFTPLFALSLYLLYGAPGMPGQPHAQHVAELMQREKVHNAQITDLVTKVEARLREAPEDGKGWDVIAPVYFKMGRFRDAANAFAQANRLLGETPARLSGFADASVFAADGIVTEAARKAYERILALEPQRPEPRFWLALAKEQDGDLKGALGDFQALVASAPADAPWKQAVEERMEAITARLEGKAPPAKGPSADEMAAAEKLDPAARLQMIEGMVAGLAKRLEQDGKDLGGWVRLVRAYAVLKRSEDARAALAQARKALAGDDGAQKTLTQLANSLGLDS